MRITIEGKPGEGKSTLAMEIVRGKEFISICQSDLNNVFWAEPITKQIDFIIVDEVTDFELMKKMFSGSYLMVNRRLKHPISIEMPHIILIRFNR